MSNESFITVVSGIPRSGTSLVMQMLGAGGLALAVDDLRSPDAHNPRGYFELDAVKRLAADTRCIGSARGRAVKVVHALLRHLPGDFDYRVIFVHRDLREVIASQNAMLERSGAASEDCESAGLERLLRVQRDQSERWIQAQGNARLVRVHFSQILADPETASRALAGFLELPLDTAKMAEAVAPALYRQRVSGVG